MKKIELKCSAKKPPNYKIFIGSDIMEKVSSIYSLSNYSRIFIITDRNVAPIYLNRLESACPAKTTSIILPFGERSKGIKNIQNIWKVMHDAGCDRSSLVINLGGGVIGDMGGFAASTYMRGVDFINIPTTLLAQVDASIGGKTGINFEGIKNLIGTFNQPNCVIIDTQTLNTLPKPELISGFAEIIKHGLIQDELYFERVISKQPHQFSPEDMVSIISRSCEIKAAIVVQDETENDLRKILNFGHTIGHAIESLSLETTQPLLHGEAISLGMVVESSISHLKGQLSRKDLKHIQTGLANIGLPTSLLDVNIDGILQKIKSDKKNKSGNVNFSLLQRIGKAVFDQRVPEKIIIKSLQYIVKGRL
jgi:3-dehydroquinate synthase